MRILVVSNLFPPDVVGGYELACASMVEGLRRRGHDVMVLTSVPRVLDPQLPDGREDTSSTSKANTHQANGHVLRTMRCADVFSTARPFNRSSAWEIEANLVDSGNVFALVSVLHRFQPEVCYLWNLIGVGGIGLVGALEYMGVPWVWHLEDAVPAHLCILKNAPIPLARLLAEHMTGRFLAVSQGLVYEIEHVVALGDSVRIIPNWVDVDPGGLEREYFDGSCLRIVFSGRLTEEKGLFVLLDALSLLSRDGYRGFTVDLVGRGENLRLVRVIRRLGIEGLVRIKGWVDHSEMAGMLRFYDLLAFPTVGREPFGNVAIEAGAQGCVPLISARCGVSEWLVDGVDCLKAQRDPSSFAQAIARVLRGEVDLGAIGRRAAAVVRRDFTLDRVVPVVEEELSIAAGQSPRQTSRDGSNASHGSIRKFGRNADGASAYRIALIAEAIARSSLAPGRQVGRSGGSWVGSTGSDAAPSENAR